VGPYNVSHALFNNIQAGPGERCAITRVDNCIVGDCRVPPDADAGTPGDGGTLQFAFVGDINLATATSTITLSPGAAGDYESISVMSARWAPGERITFQSSGSREVPRFKTELPFPGDLEVLSPQVSSYWEQVPLDRTQDFTATWTPVSKSVWVNVIQSSGAQQDLQIICEFAGTKGSGTIPKELLARLSAGSNRVDSRLALVRGERADLFAGDYPLVVFVWSGTSFYLDVP